MTLSDRLLAEGVLLATFDFDRACEGDVNEEIPIPAGDDNHPYSKGYLIEFALINRHLKELEGSGSNCFSSGESYFQLVGDKIRRAWGYR